jgi:hypothetical protein
MAMMPIIAQSRRSSLYVFPTGRAFVRGVRMRMFGVFLIEARESQLASQATNVAVLRILYLPRSSDDTV